jgi:hypothetical protein
MCNLRFICLFAHRFRFRRICPICLRPSTFRPRPGLIGLRTLFSPPSPAPMHLALTIFIFCLSQFFSVWEFFLIFPDPSLISLTLFFDHLASLLARQAAEMAINQNFKKAREFIQNRTLACLRYARWTVMSSAIEMALFLYSRTENKHISGRLYQATSDDICRCLFS